MTIVTLGPATNLAAALAKDSSITTNIRRVVLMGGELTGGKMCLNFMSDRAAARAVLAAPVPTMLVPIQTCAQAAFTGKDLVHMEHKCSCTRHSQRRGEGVGAAQTSSPAAACALVAKMGLQVRVMPKLVNTYVAPKLPAGSRWTASNHLRRGFIPWDVVAILAAFEPHRHFGEWEMHRVGLPRCLAGEPCNGTMAVEPGAQWSGQAAFDAVNWPDSRRTEWRNVALVPHKLLDEAALVGRAIDLMCAVPAAKSDGQMPALLLGFVWEVGVVTSATLAALQR